MKEKLQFTIEDQAIAELFGRTNFSTKESAIFELIKNSFDAGAKNCVVNISEDTIEIIDNGKGMNSEEIKLNWMHVGKSDKDYEEENRVLAGSKGVGRFALARLGDNIEVLSKKKSCMCVRWTTDWLENELDDESNVNKIGTKIVINSLRDKWKKKDVENVIDFLNRAYNDTVMEIQINYENNKTGYIEKKIQPIFFNKNIGENFVNKVVIFFDSYDLKLYVEIESDEFKEEVRNIVDINIDYNFFTIDIRKKYATEIKNDLISESELSAIGNFVGIFYFSLDRAPTDSTEKYMYKHEVISDRLNTGIILFRNSFSISSLNGKKDWVGLGARARKSPAAASHPNGSWRVRQNQISGEVHIDKKLNNKLVDLANRQGLDENEYYEYFVKIIDTGIDSFEDFRQNIIRKIAQFRKEESPEQKQEKKIEKFLKSPSLFKKMEDEDIEALAKEVKHNQEIMKKNEAEAGEIEKQYKYDARILNLLATQGLKANGIAHELHTDRNYLDQGYKKTIQILDELGFWEELNSEENTEIASKNVPLILNELEKINIKLKIFLDSMLGQIEKKQFKEEINSLEEAFLKIRNNWKRDYDWVDITISGNELMESNFLFSSDIISVIFDNLILNSIQQNPKEQKLKIDIEYELIDNRVYFTYEDNGCGLPPKFQDDHFKIMKVHESSREDGHGLGMWLVERTIKSLKGLVTDIKSETGFLIKFYIEGVAN